MTVAMALDWMRELFWVALITAGPAVLAVVAVGFVVAIFQAVTQIHDQSVGFGPKALAMVVALVVAGPWMLSEVSDFTRHVVTSVAHVTSRR